MKHQPTILETFGVNPVAMVAMPPEVLRKDLQQVLITAAGCCLDSPESPIKIQHGDKLLIHQQPLTDEAIKQAVGQMVVIKKRDGQMIAKHLTAVDIAAGDLYVKQYNPQRGFIISLDNVAALFVVDRVFTPEYINNRMSPA